MDLPLIDEREDVQKKTFTKWINSYLAKGNHDLVVDLFADLHDGTKLLFLLEVLTSQKIKLERGCMRLHYLNNVSNALRILKQNNVKLVNISSNDIVDGNAKLILGLVWSIILHYQVHYHLKNLMAEFQQTNLEKTLLAWCRQNTAKYVGVNVKNFTSSWCDGLAFNALIHRFRPDLFDFHELASRHPNARLEHAFQTARDHLNIERLLDPEDVNTSQPDKKSIMTYVMCLFQSLPSSANLEDASFDFSDSSSVTTPTLEHSKSFDCADMSNDNRRISTLSNNTLVELAGYQEAVEEVLTWLLEAEDRLNKHGQLPSDLESMKKIFRAHEEFLLELSSQQQDVGAILEEGARMLSDGNLCHQEEDEVRIQMQLLNSKWETLRLNAMEMQSKIHANLMNVQQKELDVLKHFLTSMEDRISHMSEFQRADVSSLRSQLDSLRQLQCDLQHQQHTVNSLSNIVVIVDDDNTIENAGSQMEDQLVALGERWDHICKWAEDRWSKLHTLMGHHNRIKNDSQHLKAWLTTNEKRFKQMETEPVEEVGEISERIKQLQELRMQMVDEQWILNGLQESVLCLYEIDRSEESSKCLEQVEYFQDKLDALLQIIETQAHRINSLGFEFSLLPETDDDPSRVSEYNVNNEKIKQRRKRRRTASVKCLELESAVTELSNWLSQTLETLHAPLHPLDNPDLISNICNELPCRHKELSNISALNAQCANEFSNSRCVEEDDNKNISALNMEFSKVEEQLSTFQQQIMSEYRELKNKLELLLNECDTWLVRGPFTVDKYKENVILLKSQENEIEKLKKYLKLIAIFDQQVVLEGEALAHFWEEHLLRMTSFEDELMEIVRRETATKFEDTKRKVTEWIHNVEGLLLSDYPVITNLTEMSVLLRKFQDLENNVLALEEDVKYLNSVANSDIFDGSQRSQIEKELSDLNSRWKDLPMLLKEPCALLTKGIEKISEFEDKLHRVECELKNKQDEINKYISGIDYDEFLSNETNFRDGFQWEDDMVKSLVKCGNGIDSLENDLSVFEELNTNKDFMSHLKEKVFKTKSLKQKLYETVEHFFVDLKNLHNLYQQVKSKLQDLRAWLEDFKTGCDSKSEISDVTSSRELFNVKTKYEQLANTVQRKRKELERLHTTGDKLLSILEEKGCAKTKKIIETELCEMSDDWNNATSEIGNKRGRLVEASAKYSKFKMLLAQETDWMDKLERQLRKSPKNAADVEEISEELDHLENSLRSHPQSQLQQIQDIGQFLIDDRVMSDKMQSDVTAVTNRWNRLTQQATDRTELLEKSVAEAQQSESRITDLEEWLIKIENRLISLEEDDITADDISEDVQKMADEFATRAKEMHSLDDQVVNYQISGKQEAANRLKDQLTHLKKCFYELEEKFERYRSPSTSLEPRLMRAFKELREIEESLCLLELASDDPEGIEGQIKYCSKFFNALNDLKGEVESVIQMGKKMIEDKVVQNLKDYRLRLDALKTTYNQLGNKIADAKETLKRSFELSQNLQSDIPALNTWLSSVDNVLDQIDSTPQSERDLDIEISFIKETIDVQLVKWGALKDSINSNYAAFAKLCDPVYLENLRSRLEECNQNWNRVATRLHQTYDSMQNGGGKNSSSFIAGDVNQLPLNKNDNELCERKNSSDDDILAKECVTNVKTTTGISNGDFSANHVASSVVETTNRELNDDFSANQIITDVVETTNHNQTPQTVEVVEIIEDFDDQDEKQTCSSPMYQRKVSEKRRSHMSPCEKLAKKPMLDEARSLKKERFFSSDESIGVEGGTVISEIEDDSGCNSNMDVSKSGKPLSLEMTDLIARSEQATVTCNSDRKQDNSPKSLTFKKEVQLSTTYCLLGSYDENQKVSSSSVENENSDTPLSEDEGHYTLMPSSGSSNDEFQNNRPVKILSSRKIEFTNIGADSSSNKGSNEIPPKPLRKPICTSPMAKQRRIFETSANRDDDAFIKELNAELDSMASLETSQRGKEASIRADYDEEKYERKDNATNKIDDYLKMILLQSSAKPEEKVKLEVLKETIEKANELLAKKLNPSDEQMLTASLDLIKEFDENLIYHRHEVNKFTSVLLHEKRNVILLIDEVRHNLITYLEYVAGKLTRLKKFLTNLQSTSASIRKYKLEIEKCNPQSSPLKTPSKNSNAIRGILSLAMDKKESVKEVLDDYSNLEKECESSNYRVNANVQTKLKTLKGDWHNLLKYNNSVKSAGPAAQSTPTEDIYAKCKKPGQLASPMLGDGFDTQSKGNIQASPSPSSRHSLLASFDKSILQIRDWLTFEEQMLKQQKVIVGDIDDIQHVLEKQRNVLRELEQKKPQLDELVHTAENLKADTNRQQLHAKVTKLREHWDETNSKVCQRKCHLDEMLQQSQQCQAKCSEVQSWISRMHNRTKNFTPIGHTADVLEKQLNEQKTLKSEIEAYKHRIDEFNKLIQSMAEKYKDDDIGALEKKHEQINQSYNQLSTTIIARGKALQTVTMGPQNLQASTDKFLAWLSEMESSLDSIEVEIEKSHGRNEQIQVPKETYNHFQDIQNEINGHQEMFGSLNGSGKRLLGSLASQEDAVMLQRRLDEMNHRWTNLKSKSVAIRNRLENNVEYWNSLLEILQESVDWVTKKDCELTSLMKNVSELKDLQKQADDHRAFKQHLENKRPIIETHLMNGRQYVSNEPTSAELTAKGNKETNGNRSADYKNAEEEARELTRCIRKEMNVLTEKWKALLTRSDQWQRKLEDLISRISLFQKNMEEVSNRLRVAENVVKRWKTPTDGSKVPQLLDELRCLGDSLCPLQRTLETVNHHAAQQSSSGTAPVSSSDLVILVELNERWRHLQLSMDSRYKQLHKPLPIPPPTVIDEVECEPQKAIAQFSSELSNSQSFLAESVEPPWERAVTVNNMPYYINHETQTTDWDHPKFAEFMNSLCYFNDVRYSAYRTALKLRAIQKKLHLHLVDLNCMIEAFDTFGLRAQNDQFVDVMDMLPVITTIYQSASKEHPGLIDLPLTTDFLINWILNVYNGARSGLVRILSFKVGLALISNADLVDKYKYLYRLIADVDGRVVPRKLGLLLYDCIQIPKLLGELAAFGGTNIEPSVSSCFALAGGIENAKIEAVHFLSWLQQEPQCLVWMPVLHRIASAEGAVHHSRCNICKEYPMVGLRYRCLKCISFDMCQKCFFAGRVAKSHKQSHPMQEYCSVATSSEDMRDFSKCLRNKFKSKRYFEKHPRVGYLPVDSPTPAPRNPSNSLRSRNCQTIGPHDMKSTVERYNAQMAQIGLRTRSNSTPRSNSVLESDDALTRSNTSHNRSEQSSESTSLNTPSGSDSKKLELENMIRELEAENSALQNEYDRLRGSEGDIESSVIRSDVHYKPGASEEEKQMAAEARMLRQHKGRLEARMQVLEDHNKQLETQLTRLKELLEEPKMPMHSVTASELATNSPVKQNGYVIDSPTTPLQNGSK